jgi:hypothetical protein
VRDVGVELVGEVFDVSPVFPAPELVHQLLQYAVALLDVLLGELPQWHLLDVVADLRHLLLHHVDVEDQLYQFLGGGGQLALLKLLLIVVVPALPCAVLLLLIVPVVALEVQLDLLVVPPVALLSVLAVVLANCGIDGERASHAILSAHAHSPPAGVDVAGVGVCVWLDDLDDVELIVVVGDRCLVESGAVGLAALLQDAMGRVLESAVLVDRHLPLELDRLYLLLCLLLANIQILFPAIF